MNNRLAAHRKRFKLNLLSYGLFGIVFIGALLNWSCSGLIQSIAVEGKESDLALLAGKWEGEYYSKDLGRGGRIEFKLTAGENAATGEVIMIPRNPRESQQPITQTGEPRIVTPSLEILSIRFVQIGKGRVSGKLDPYWDPDNKVTLITYFDGTVKENVIEGTFRSRRKESGYFYTGRWKVTRKK
jgi:hypothetical protein